MTIATHFIETIGGAWIKGVPCLIPNLQEGRYVITMDAPATGYRKWRWRIDKIETIIGSDVDSVLQNVLMTSCGPEEDWQRFVEGKKE